MNFTPEIKNFIKNTLIFTLTLALLINIFWDSLMVFLGFSAKAHNEKSFSNANIAYVGTTATALSLRIGGINNRLPNGIIDTTVDTISIAEVLGNTAIGQERLISSNMLAISSYAGILKTDIIHLLESANNRTAALDAHISLLKSYFLKTEDRLGIIRDQKNDLNALLSQAKSEQKTAKNLLQESYKQMQYSGVDGAISQYLLGKNLESRARIYLIYLDRFEKSYRALQNKNKKVLDAIINNREAIINKSIVVIPSTGTDIIKELGLIQSEADYKAQKALDEQ